MDPQDIKDHSKFTYYVSVNIPQVREMPFIINALKRFSGNGTERAIKDALLWNKGPMIKIVEGLVCAGAPAYGCYQPNSDVIQMDKETVDLFESGKDLRKTTRGRLVYLVGVKLLHELCHWANDDTVKDDLTHEKFEQALYGKVIV